MNKNDENVNPMRDAAPDVEHLRLEISENEEVFYRIDDVMNGGVICFITKTEFLLISFLICALKRDERIKRDERKRDERALLEHRSGKKSIEILSL